MNIVIGELVDIPRWVEDLQSFRRWARSEDFPEHGSFSHLNGNLWVDVSMETVAHNQIKGAFPVTLIPLVKKERRGRYLNDRKLLTNEDAGLSTEPDGMFVSREALTSGRVQITEGEETREIVGSPDMVLEVVSKSSVKKDTVVLRDLYWKAEVAEYWLAELDAEGVRLRILRRGAARYVAVREQNG
jgi:Uma2 family endonuclease